MACPSGSSRFVFRATLARLQSRMQRTMPAPRRVKISAVDTAWLRMDRPQNLMMICGVLLFREKLSLARLRKVIGERFVVFKRFRQRPVQMPGVAFWENDPHFDIAHHVLRMALPGRAGRRELRDFVSGLATT